MRWAFCVSLSCAMALTSSQARAGGMKGRMFNLPDQKKVVKPIDKKETIGIVVRDLDGNRLTLLDSQGSPFPPDQFANGQLFVLGADFSFTVERVNDGRKSRVVNIEFSRSDVAAAGTVQAAARTTEVLPSVVIANDPNEVLNVNVSVRRPRQMKAAKRKQTVHPSPCVQGGDHRGAPWSGPWRRVRCRGCR
jgi:hypothetical protein